MYHQSALREELLEWLKAMILEKFSGAEADCLLKVLEQHYISVSDDDLNSKTVLDWFGALVSHWNFIKSSQVNKANVKIYNPYQERNGWQSSHTVLEIMVIEKPFLIDSIKNCLKKLELKVHMQIKSGRIWVNRDKNHKIIEVSSKPILDNNAGYTTILFEIDRQSNEHKLETIQAKIYKIISDVDLVVADLDDMLNKLEEVKQNILKSKNSNNKIANKSELAESAEFLNWLSKNHFIFFGYGYFKLQKNNIINKKSDNLGLIKVNPERAQSCLKIEDYFNGELDINPYCMIGKTNQISYIHRNTYPDFVAIYQYDENGNKVGMHKFIGLYTAFAYHCSTNSIPLIQNKNNQILDLSGFQEGSYEAKEVMNIIETLPREDVLYASADELVLIALGIMYLHQRPQIKFFMRKDFHAQYYSCLVFFPREKLQSSLRIKFQEILMHVLNGKSIEFSVNFFGADLVRIQFEITVDINDTKHLDIKDIEQLLINASKTWDEELEIALIEHSGEEVASDVLKEFRQAFPTSYQENYAARIAVTDIQKLQLLSKDIDADEIGMSLYCSLEDKNSIYRFKLYRKENLITLSDVVPMLENMGFKIINERPYEIKANDKGKTKYWINDYCIEDPCNSKLDLTELKDIFQNAFDAIWHKRAENDKLNKLVLRAKLNWQEVAILRAYGKYLWQVNLVFSTSSIEDALFKHHSITKKIILLFKLRFDPTNYAAIGEQNKLIKNIEEDLDEVSLLSEDRIFRHYISVIMATIRTNYFKYLGIKSTNICYSFKIESAKIPNLPLPIPLFEIFVYSPTVEGIHLRGGRVARGGLRWSDRMDDFRTEVLGLMKAQQVKNSVIVPLGAKGGFVVKHDMENLSREQRHELGEENYKIFIRGMLDLSDNLIKNEVHNPSKVVCYDDYDPYLVVAADKGTATFSDIANSISEEYNFWLGDAFASGGSCGYDHKKMGITAKGAWESVKLHFQFKNHDVQSNPFTVIAIGDMSGDVFGNGMLLSEQIKLVFAFNHKHIFIDPNPDPKISYDERNRLFKLPRSNWDDYSSKLISKGGGIHLRTAKAIALTPEVKTLLNVSVNHMQPNELIKAAFMADIDLLWNGGIGTYVKASNESNQDVGDRANDSLRIDAKFLGCKVVGEGGNLGFTQLARVEYAAKGGIINTDAIDNSAGVNCSDLEVNIKILLHSIYENGDITHKQRNKLLESMSDEVSALVLNNNCKQNNAISMESIKAENNLSMHNHLMYSLEEKAGLNRNIEFLPDKQEITKRKAANKGLTRPEIAILMAYTKNCLKNKLQVSDIVDDPFVLKELLNYFPTPIRIKYPDYIKEHRLKNEIIATQLSNSVVNDMGINFIDRLSEETGTSSAEIVRAYLIAKEVFNFNQIKISFESLRGNISGDFINVIVSDLIRLVRRATRWFLQNHRSNLNIEQTIELFSTKISYLKNNLNMFLPPSLIESLDKEKNEYIEKFQISEELAINAASITIMYSSLDIVLASIDHDFDLCEVANVYFGLGTSLELHWFRKQIKSHPISNNWESQARAVFRDDVDRHQCNLAIALLSSKIQDKNSNTVEYINLWLEKYSKYFNRWKNFISEIKSSKPEFTLFAVAIRELFDVCERIKSHSKSVN